METVIFYHKEQAMKFAQHLNEKYLVMVALSRDI